MTITGLLSLATRRKIRRFTVLSALLLRALTMISYADTHAQSVLDTPISVEFRNVPLREAISRIGEAGHCKFIYAETILPLERTVSLQAQNRTVQQVLNELLRPYGVTYRPARNYIYINAKPRPPNLVGTVKGRVTDASSGEGLPGANVQLKGTSIGTTTGADGTYALNITDESTGLVFSYIGYLTKEVRIGQQTVVNAALAPSANTLSQVVVVGYQTQQRRDVTGAIGTVSAQQVRETPISNIEQALQGRVAGVQVTQTSGQPGGGISVRIRGASSITAGNEPLYVIDGIPFYNWNTTLNQGPAGIFGTGQVSNALSAINPNDIESITVLKDAAAASIYGSRAANGVVLVTTKRGKAGRGRIEFDSYYGTQSLARGIDVLDAQQMAELTNEARANGRADLGNPASPGLNLRPVPAFQDPAALGTGTDWQGQLFRPAPIQNYQLSLSGGNDQTQYALSGAFFNQEGILKVSGYKRYSARINLDQKVTERFKAGASMVLNNATNTINRAFGEVTQGGLIYGALLQTPALPVYDANGDYARPDVSTSGRFVGLTQIDNPLSSALEYLHSINTTRVIGNLFGEYKITGDLTLRTSVGVDANYLKNNIFIPIRAGSVDRNATGNPVFVDAPTPNTGNGFAFASQELVWLNENILTYNKTLGGSHKLSAVGGFTQQGANFERMISRVQNFPNNLVSTTNGGQTDLTNNFIEQWRIVSFLGKINYAYHEKYLATVGFRTDGSSRFGPGRRFGYFPSVSVGWRLSDEPFLKSVPFISDLKLRASYGMTGNAEITNTVNSFANYAYLGSIIPANYAFGQTVVNGLAPGSLTNNDLGWETTTQTDIGLDASLWNGRLTLSADWYDKTTRDLLLRGYPLPYTTGFTSSFRNIGRMRNRGAELGIQTVNIDRAVRWKTDGNVSYNRNKVLALGPDVPFINDGNSTTRPGESVGQFFGFATNGIFRNQAEIDAAAVQNGVRTNTRPGDVRFVDQNGDGVINAADRTLIGNPMPTWLYGLTNSIAWKGLDLTVFLQGVAGNTVYNRTRQVLESMNGAANGSATTLNRWQSEQTPGNGTLPRATAADPNNNNRFSTRWLEDGSFLRLKNVTLAYTLPASVAQTLRMQRLRVYATGQNLLTVTKYTGYDPEFNRQPGGTLNPLSFGTDDSNYPVSRTLILGVNLQF